MGDLAGLVVASEDGNAVLEADLEGDEERDGLDGVVAAIDVVAHEEVVRVGGLASDLEQLAQVVELSVDIATDGHRGAHLLHVGLIDQDFLCLSHKSKS